MPHSSVSQIGMLSLSPGATSLPSRPMITPAMRMPMISTCNSPPVGRECACDWTVAERARSKPSVARRHRLRREPVDGRGGQGDEEDAGGYHRVAGPRTGSGRVELETHPDRHGTQRQAEAPDGTQHEHPRTLTRGAPGSPWLDRVVSGG